MAKSKKVQEDNLVVYTGSRSSMPFAGLGLFYKDVPRGVPPEAIDLFARADNFDVMALVPEPPAPVEVVIEETIKEESE